MSAYSIEALPLNIAAFSKIAAGPDPSSGVVFLATYIGEFAPLLILALFAIAWLAGGERRRRIVFISVATATLALTLNFLIATGFPQPRPFEIGLGQNLLHHAPEASFPSDHATLVWALALGLLAAEGSPTVAIAIAVCGLAVAWARVFLGAHFPLDMIGSFVVAGVSAMLARLSGAWLYSATYLPVAMRLGILSQGRR
jgi:undecaprenyl-diphosphatase